MGVDGICTDVPRELIKGLSDSVAQGGWLS
jgi:hypothetical protein